MSVLILKFRGGDADDHRLDAYAGGMSLSGIAKGLERIGHYAVTGKIRKQFPYDTRIRFFIETPSPGSLEWAVGVYFAVQTAFAADPLLGGLTTNALYDLVKMTFGRAIGNGGAPQTEQTNLLDDRKGGDVEALVDSVESPMREAHTVIGNSAHDIQIVNGQNNVVINHLTLVTKEYVTITLKGDSERVDVSVGSLNANQGTGRAWFGNLGKLVPFNVSNKASSRTLAALSWGIDQYVNKTGQRVSIIYEPLRAADGRLKRIIIYDAEPASDENYDHVVG
jgi:hypothetical protein